MGYGMMGNLFGYGYNYGNGINWWWMLGSGIFNVLIITGIIFILYKLIRGKQKSEQ